MTRRISFSALIYFSLASLLGAALVDSDGNGLDDAWEMIFFGSLGNDPAADVDGDGQDNLGECAASTDPTDAASVLSPEVTAFGAGRGIVSWQSVPGKRYRVEFSDDLVNWSRQFGAPWAPYDFIGNGGLLRLDLSTPAEPVLTGAVTRELWLGAGNSGSVDQFKTELLSWTDPLTPALPGLAVPQSGRDTLGGGLRSPTNYGDQYAQRLRGYLRAPESGQYVFHIAGRHQCEFWLSPVAGSGSPLHLQRVLRQLNSQIAAPEDWSFYQRNGITPDEQTSTPITLIAGEAYYFELLHRHNGQEDHLAVGWTKPSDTPGSIEVIPAEVLSPAADLSGVTANPLRGRQGFVRVTTYGPDSPLALDTDGDGIGDATENLLAGFNPFDPSSTGQPDSLTLTETLAATTDTISVTVPDPVALEDNGLAGDGSPRLRDVARFKINRSGTLRPQMVFFTISGGDGLVDGAPQEENDAEPGDFVALDSGGNPVGGSIFLPAGATSVDVVIEATPDQVHEYPEVVSLSIDPHPAYEVDLASERRECLIFDQRDEPENEILFVGFSVPQPGSKDPRGSAICSGKLSAKKDRLTLFTSISAGFSTPMINSHVHKDEGAPGSDPVTFSLPQTGEIANLEWPLHDNGSYSPQEMIDSLFNQVDESETPGESKLYVNWHTDANVGGELYAFLVPAVGSVSPPIPEAPGAIAFIDPVSQETELRREITRFLVQSTFGPTPELVDYLYGRVLAAPGNDRIAVFDAWLDEQLDPAITPQTSITQNTFAAEWQGWVLRGYFDPTFYEDSDWGSDLPPQDRTPPEDPVVAPPKPAAWPKLAAHDPDALDYANPETIPRPTADWPLANSHINRVYRNSELSLGRERDEKTRHALWTAMIDGKDQVRQRLAFAWSQIMVVSTQDPTTKLYYYGLARYWDMLAENCDDQFRDMLEGVTYSPVMGNYLSHLKNQAEADLDGDGDPDVFPDENYAREIMQLFSIGLSERHLDGSLVLDAETGLPRATYDNTDITELSRIMTGFTFSKNAGQTTWDNPLTNTTFNRSNGNQWYGATYEYPMAIFGLYHDAGTKTIAGGVVVDNTHLIGDPGNPTEAELTAVGHADVAAAHDWLAGSGAAPYDGHTSTPAFIARRLIQRLVTSNPPRDYVYRVAKRFDETGGDLKEVSKAILLDPHARSPEQVDATYGRKKPPLMAYLQMLRALGGWTDLPIAELGDDTGSSSDYGLSAQQRGNYTTGKRFRFHNTTNNLSMAPLGAETVFNFYLPDYSPPGPLSSAALAAPEFQIFNETTAIQNVNFFYVLAWSGGTPNNGQGLNTLPNQQYWGYDAIADHARLDRDRWIDFYKASPGAEWERDKALVDALDEILNAGQLQQTYLLDPADRTPVGNALVVADPEQNPYEAIIDALTDSYGTSDTNIRDKVRLAFYLMTATPTYQIQK